MAKAKQNKPETEDLHVYLSLDAAKKLRLAALKEKRSVSSQVAYIVENWLASAA